MLPNDLSKIEINKLLHELQTYQIELQIQNEELQDSQLKLIKSQNKYVSLYDNAPINCLTISEKGIITEANLTSTKLFGIERSKIINKRFSQFIVNDDQDKFYHLQKNLLKKKTTKEIDLRILNNNEEIIWVNLQCDLDYINGEISGVNIVLVDISERKKAETELSKSEEKYCNLLEFAQEGIWEIDKNAITTFVNASMARMLGYSIEDMLGKHIFSFMDREGKILAIKNFRKSKKGERTKQDFKFLSKNGQPIIATVATTPLFDEAKNYSGTLAAIIDITKHKLLEKQKLIENQIREANNKLAQAQEIGKIGNWELDLISGELYWSDNLFRLFGHEPNEIKPSIEIIRNLVHPDDLELFDQQVEKTIKEKSPFSFESRIIDTSKNLKWISANGKVICSEGNSIKIVGTIQDITEQKKAEDELQISAERYRGLSQASFEAIFISEKGICLEQNATAEKMFGYSLKDAIGRQAIEWIHPKDHELVINNIKLGKEDPYEITALRKNKSTFQAEIQARMMHYKDRKVRVTALSDITIRKEIENNLGISEKKYRSLFNNTVTGITVTNLKGNILDANPSVIKATGYTQEEMLNLNIKDLYGNPDDRNIVLKKIKENGKIENMEFQMKHRDGHFVWSNFSTIQVFYEDEPVFITTVINVDDQKKAETLLRESEEKYRSLFENSLAGITITNLESEILVANPAVLNAFGYTSDEIKNVNMNDLYGNPDDRKNILKHIKKHGKIENMEMQMKGYNGELFWCNCASSQILFQNEPAFITATISIDEQKKAEKKLRESEEKFRSLVNGMTETVWIFDAEGKLLDVNKYAETQLGYSKSELLKIGIHGVDCNFNDQNMKEISKALSPGEIKIIETLHKAKDGTIIPVEIYDSITSIDGKKVVLSIGRDISDRKKALEKLERSEKKYRFITENVNDVIWTTDKEFQFTYISPTVKNLTGFEPEEALLHRFQDLLTEESNKVAEETIRKLRTSFANNETDIDNIVLEIQLRKKDGSLIWVEIVSNILLDKNGKFNGLLGVSRDINKRKEAEGKLKLSNEKLRKLSQRINNLIERERAEISREIHDVIGQALTSMKFDVSWLLKKQNPTNQNVKLKLNDIKDLIDKTTSDVQKIAMELRPGLLDDLGLIYALNWYSKQFENRTNIKCNIEIFPEEFLLDEKISIELFRIIQESLTNVSRHAKASKVNIILSINNDILQLRIIDNGIGITEKELDNTNSLGLIGIAERVYSINGELKITGKENIGTEVYITLPTQKGK